MLWMGLFASSGTNGQLTSGGVYGGHGPVYCGVCVTAYGWAHLISRFLYIRRGGHELQVSLPLWRHYDALLYCWLLRYVCTGLVWVALRVLDLLLGPSASWCSQRSCIDLLALYQIGLPRVP